MTSQDFSDLVRVINIPMAAITCGVSLAIVTGGETRSTSQQLRFLSLIFLCGGLAIGEYQALGRPPHWWGLAPISVGIWLSTAGCLPLLFGKRRSASLRDEAAQPPLLGREDSA